MMTLAINIILRSYSYSEEDINLTLHKQFSLPERRTHELMMIYSVSLNILPKSINVPVLKIMSP